MSSRLALVSLTICLISTTVTEDIETEVLFMPETCDRLSKVNDFLTIHFTSSWSDGTVITSTEERGVPVEIQLGTKMLSSGLDAGLKDMCIGERRRISLPATMGALDMVDFSGSDDRSIVYDVQLMGISDATTGATFKFLDLDGDKKISADEAESLVKMFMKALTTEIPGLDSATLVKFFMTLHDRDGDGFISEPEFLNSVAQHEKVLSAIGSKDEL